MNGPKKKGHGERDRDPSIKSDNECRKGHADNTGDMPTSACQNSAKESTPSHPDDKAKTERREKIEQEARRRLEEDRKRIAEQEEKRPTLPSIRTEPQQCAQVVLDRFFTKNKFIQVRFYRETWYSYYNGIWEQRTEQDMDHFIHNFTVQCRSLDRDGMPQDFVSSRANVSEIRFQLAQLCGIPSHYNVPLYHDGARWVEIEANGKMVCRGELVDMITREARSNQDVFIPNGAAWVWRKKPPKPRVWHKFLDDLFGDRDQEKELLLQFMGYILSGDTWAQKGLILVGPKRSGKGTIGHVLKHLLGKSMVASPSLKSIGDNFGLENMVDKRLCLISDARLSTRQDTMAVIEMLLRIIAGDPVDVTRKHKTALTLELGARVMLLSNSLPSLGDDSDAITSRFLIIHLTESFYEREDHELKNKLLEELPGIALEAVEAYRRLMDRGRFEEPESSSTARAEWYTENNPVVEFLDECCVVDRSAEVKMPDLADAYEEWREAHKLNSMPRHVLSRKIGAILGPKIHRAKGADRRIEGLGLKPRKERGF